MTGPELIEALETAGRSDLWRDVVAARWLKTLIGLGLGACLSAAGMAVALVARRRVEPGGWEDADGWAVAAVVSGAVAVVGLALALSLVPDLLYPEAAALRSLLR